MKSPRASLKSQILAVLAIKRSMTIAQLCADLSYPERTVRSAISELRAEFAIEKHFVRWSKTDRVKLYTYRLKVAFALPKMGAGEYMGSRPSGTKPRSISRLTGG